MNQQMFFIWVAIATVQIILFARFLFKKDSVTTEKTVDIFPVVTYNSMTYWSENGKLFRSKSRTATEKDIEMVDPLDPKDLSFNEVMAIYEALER